MSESTSQLSSCQNKGGFYTILPCVIPSGHPPTLPPCLHVTPALLFHLCYFLKHALPTFGYSTVSAPPTFYQIIVSSRTIVQTPVAIIPRDSSCDAGRHYHHQCSSRWVHFLRCTRHLEAMVLSYLFGSTPVTVILHVSHDMDSRGYLA